MSESTENGHPVELGEGIWKTAEAVTFRLDAIDPEGGEAGAESVIKDDWVVSVRRYPVLDEQHGSVLAIVLIRISSSQSVLLGEMFKVSGGKPRQVQAVMLDVPHDGPTGWN